MIKWEEHGRERMRARARRVASAAATTASTAAAAASPPAPASCSAAGVAPDQATGTKRSLEGMSQPAGPGPMASTGGIGIGAVGADVQGRQKMMRTETGSVPGTGASVPVPAPVAVAGGSEGGPAVAESTTDSFTLNRSSVREGTE